MGGNTQKKESVSEKILSQAESKPKSSGGFGIGSRTRHFPQADLIRDPLEEVWHLGTGL